MNSDFLIALDVETTGMNYSNGDRVCEIGAVKFDKKGNEVEKFDILINPDMPMPYEATRVNGITDEMLASCPKFMDVADSFLAFVKDLPLLAYNAGFDMGFLNKELQLCGGPLLDNQVIDVLEIARRMLPGLSSYKLASVAKYLGIEEDMDYHRAYADAFIMGRVFFEIARRI